jgi:hypothetical protein
MICKPIIKPEWIPSAYNNVRGKHDFQPADAIPSSILKQGKGIYKRKDKQANKRDS